MGGKVPPPEHLMVYRICTIIHQIRQELTRIIMLLAIDVGNTHTVIGAYGGEELRASWRIPTCKEDTPDAICARLLPLMEVAGMDSHELDEGILACVVPMLTRAWSDAISALCGSPALIVSAKTAGSLFCADYPAPQEIGADRIADAVALKALYGCPSIVVDFGTATNMEVIDRRGRFIGGIIAPGLQTSAQTLISRGAQLSSINLTAPEHAIGRGTEEALKSGIVFGEADRVDGLIRRIKAELGEDAFVVATGGLAEGVASLAQEVDDVNPDLTLIGLRLISEEHRKRAKEDAC